MSRGYLSNPFSFKKKEKFKAWHTKVLKSLIIRRAIFTVPYFFSLFDFEIVFNVVLVVVEK